MEQGFDIFHRRPPYDPQLLILPILFLLYTHNLFFNCGDHEQDKEVPFLPNVYDVGIVDK
jgi:hypothetical protein